MSSLEVRVPQYREKSFTSLWISPRRNHAVPDAKRQTYRNQNTVQRYPIFLHPACTCTAGKLFRPAGQQTKMIEFSSLTAVNNAKRDSPSPNILEYLHNFCNCLFTRCARCRYRLSRAEQVALRHRESRKGRAGSAGQRRQ